MTRVVHLFVVLTVATALARDGKPACTAPQFTRARDRFKHAYDAKDFAAALKVYEDLAASCELARDGEAYYWVQSDTALAQLKAGHALACLATLTPLLEPMHGYQGAGIDPESPVARALEFNASLCAKAEAERFADFSRQPCQLPQGKKRVRASVALVEGCLMLLEPAPGATCPVLKLVRKAGEAGVPLSLQEGPLADVDSCCTLSRLAVKGAQVRVESSGPRHPCTGGTAVSDNSATYRLSRTALTLEEDTTVSTY